MLCARGEQLWLCDDPWDFIVYIHRQCNHWQHTSLLSPLTLLNLMHFLGGHRLSWIGTWVGSGRLKAARMHLLCVCLSVCLSVSVSVSVCLSVCVCLSVQSMCSCLSPTSLSFSQPDPIHDMKRRLCCEAQDKPFNGLDPRFLCFCGSDLQIDQPPPPSQRAGKVRGLCKGGGWCAPAQTPHWLGKWAPPRPRH